MDETELFVLAEQMHENGECPDTLLDLAHLALTQYDTPLDAAQSEIVMDFLCEMILEEV